MQSSRFTFGLLAAAGLAVVLLGTSRAAAAPHHHHHDPVLKWNTIATDAVAADHSGTFGPPEQGGPTRTARALAIVHVAIYDAVNGIQKTHEPYLPLGLNDSDTVGASIDVAVAQAAHDTLTSLYSNQAQSGVFSDELLDVLQAEKNSVARTKGQQVGAKAALNILAARAGDGAAAGNTPIYPGTSDPPLPGEHQADPFNPGQGLLTPGWGQVDTFSLIDVTDPGIRAPAPPALGSVDYAIAFADVFSLGGDGINTPTDRTKEQTEIGIFWGYDGTPFLGPPPRLYNQIAQVIAKQEDNTVAENARLFALINMAQSDSGVACWDTKYFYNFWRPVIGIRNADDDGNDDTPLDANWSPLGAPASNEGNGGVNFTPPFPAYPSGHATFGGTIFRVLERFYGTDDIEFSFQSDEFRKGTTDNEGNKRYKVVPSWDSFSEAAIENGRSRIYLGIHWQFDADEGIDQGVTIADILFDNFLQPLP